jgi:hypothetical protein
MSHPEKLKQWRAEVSTHMPHLSRTEAVVLALYSYGMAMTKRCGLTTIVTFMSMLLSDNPNSVRQRLREWNYDPKQKRGRKRRAIDVTASFAALLKWLLHDWSMPEVVLAMDVTYLGDRFTVLAISVVYRGCAIPVAWQVRLGNAKGEWHPIWVSLLEALKPAVSADCTVFVLTDRGLYSKRLFQAICQQGWHPLMRIRTQGLYHRKRAKTWQPLQRLARPDIGIWCQKVLCFKNDPLPATLLVQWDARFDEPCLIVTDLPCHQVRTNLYALRMWIEAGFKDIKRGGLHWEHTKMTHPERVNRLWLVMAVALLWLIRVGGEVQYDWLHVSMTSPPASLSCLSLGWLTLFVAAIRHDQLPFGRFIPLDWHKFPQ